MNVVVPVRSYARLIVDSSALYYRSRRNGVLSRPLTLVEAGQLVHALVADGLSSRLHWALTSNTFTAKLSELVPGYDPDSTSRPNSLFYREVFHDAAVMIEQLLEEYVGSTSWQIWTLNPVPAPYLRHQEDVYCTYDADTMVPIAHLGGDRYEMVLRRKGDLLLDAKGRPQLLYRKGDVVLDPLTLDPKRDPEAQSAEDLILESGEDFRVYEWERLLHAQQISYSQFTPAQYAALVGGLKTEESVEDVHTPKEIRQIQAIQSQISRRFEGSNKVIRGAGVPKDPRTQLREPYAPQIREILGPRT